MQKEKIKENHYCLNPLGKSKRAEGLRCGTLLIIKDGKTVCPKCDVPYSERNMYERYLVDLGNPHNLFSKEPMRLNRIDLGLREAIGKTNDIHISLCSHIAIINRELGDNFCRVCQKDLSVTGVGRYNDHLVLRHPQCFQPICLNCAKNNPDKFHLAFKKGLTVYKERKSMKLKTIKMLNEMESDIEELTKIILGGVKSCKI